jgi:hypothetical protein
MKKIALSLFCLFTFVGFGFAQANDADELRRRESERRALEIHNQKIQREQRDLEKREVERQAVINENKRILASLRLPTPPTIEVPSENDKLLLEPSKELQTEFKDYLKTKRTGLFIIYRHPGCDLFPSARIVDSTCENNGFSINDGGSNYSFRDRKHVRGNWVDISWKSMKFVARGNALERKLIIGYVQGIISDIGNVDLNTIDVKQGAGKLLWDYLPAVTLEGIKTSSERLGKGVPVGTYSFGESADIREGRTYILRSIPYRAKDGFWNYDDTEVDIIVAFRILKKLNDDRILIGWKEIARRNSPKVTFRESKEKVILQ